jgi:hypothetical protein
METDFDRRTALLAMLAHVVPAGLARAQSAVMRPTVLFDNITPTNVIEVAPGSSIQAAVKVATPGTRINVYGVHTENVAFDPSVPTTPTAPIWLVAMDDAKIIAADKSVNKAVISGWKCSNYAVIGFAVESAWRGIYFGADDDKRASNVLVLANRVSGMAEDGIKISHITGAQTLGNTVSVCGQEGIDYVDVWNAEIAFNEVFDITGTAAGVFWKAGSVNVVCEYNYVHHCKADGISVGGQGRGGILTVPYQCKGGAVRWNRVEDVGQNPLVVKGAHDTDITDNYLKSVTYSPNVAIGNGNHDGVPRHSRNVLFTRNVLVGKTGVRVIAPSTANTAGNYPNGTWANRPIGPSAIPAWTL